MHNLGRCSKKDVAILKLKLKYSNVTLCAFGNSMRPTIEDKDMLIVKKIDDGLKVGDIVLYAIKRKDEIILITHRIVRIGNHTLLLKGDNNSTFDSLVRLKNVIGLIDTIIRYAQVH